MSQEPRPIASPSVRALPDYLGFGRLDEGTVRACKGTVSARYLWEGEVACVVVWKEGDCLIDSYSGGRLFASSCGRDLQEAFYQRFIALLLAGREDEQLVALFRRVRRVGHNLHFQVPNRANCRYIFYPAGLIFRLRQPVTDANRPAYERLAQALANRPDNRPLWVDREGPGCIVRFHTDGSHSEETVHLVDFSALLVDLVEAVRLIAESGLSLPGIEYRLAIEMPGSATLHEGEPERGYTAFTVRTQPNSNLSEKPA